MHALKLYNTTFRLKCISSALLFYFLVQKSFAQTASVEKDSGAILKEVVITGFKSDEPKHTSLNIEPYQLEEINEKAPYNLSDALAKLPGISQMTTGNSISKPVIRGLYGNRILVLLSGLRFDNQQWQDEHGLGLSQIGIDRVEIIKGPASLLYGSDALGGVIHIIEDKPTIEGKKLDIGTQLYSNTRGTLTDIGYSKKNGNKYWRIRAGYENNADYSDGSKNRVLNSRNNGYYLKYGFGTDKVKWKQENSYNFSLNQYGFILEDLPSFFDADSRWSRAMAGPHHIVMLHLANSQNTFFLKHSLLKLNAGFQSNLRMEDEGGGQISLNIHLLSLLQNLRWEKEINKHVTFVANQQYTFTNNTNYGGRILIPDATLMETNTSGFLKFYLHKIIIETGLGCNYKYIQTIATRGLNTPGEIIQPFTKNNVTGNGMLGLVYNTTNYLTIKANTATGFRAPNLAELSSNGLHEGVYRYEIGDPNLKTEQNINTDLTLEYTSQQLFVSASGFYNRFLNYIYLSPTTQSFYGFPVYKYKQQNATLMGGEAVLIVKPVLLKYIQWKEVIAVTQGIMDDDIYLPFIPPYKVSSSLRFEKQLNSNKQQLFLEPEYVYVFKQDRPAQFEKPTNAYWLLNITTGLTIKASNGNWKIGITATNLTNNTYVDHLSRLKYYGLNNQGLNIILSLRKEFK